MKCDALREKSADYLAGELDEKSLEEVRGHVADCPACREEMEGLSAIWAKLGVLPKELPGSALRSRFYEMLQAYMEDTAIDQERKGFGQALSDWLGRPLPKRPAHPLAPSLALLAAGPARGYLV